MARRVLDRLHADYVWVDLDRDPAAAGRLLAPDGRLGGGLVPTIVLPGGRVMVEPTASELMKVLSASG